MRMPWRSEQRGRRTGVHHAAGLQYDHALAVPGNDSQVMGNEENGHSEFFLEILHDFEHLGLTVSPDIDTLVYTLAGLSNTAQGWGRADETWTFMAALAALGGPDWFQLGDGDLAMHVMRTHRLAGGETLTAITADMDEGVLTVTLPKREQAQPRKITVA